jgi:hypothetical protein
LQRACGDFRTRSHAKFPSGTILVTGRVALMGDATSKTCKLLLRPIRAGALAPLEGRNKMTMTRTPSCNFCRSPIKDQDGVGFQWIGSNTLEVRPMHDVENHLCRICGNALAPALHNLFKSSSSTPLKKEGG